MFSILLEIKRMLILMNWEAWSLKIQIQYYWCCVLINWPFFFFFMFATTLYKLKAETERKFLGFPKYRHIRFFAPHTFTFPSLYLILSHTFIKKKKKNLSHDCSSTSHFELPVLFISSINYLTFSSTSLSLSPLELLELFISPIICIPNVLFKSCVEIFFSLSVIPIVQ